jgi:tetratricopeptide (TPR) repeat protein
MPLPRTLDFKSGDRLSSKITGNTWLVKEVRKGGRGIVYIVEDVPQTVTYALKTYQASYFPTDADRDRFEREALVWVSLRPHPNVVSALWIERIEGLPCLVLEYIPDGDLEHKLKKGPLKVEAALPLAFQLCDGLAYLHAKTDISHRDIKPANCMLDGALLKITDFGLAWTRVLVGVPRDDDAGLEQKNSILDTVSSGTAPYNAPEQNDSPGILNIRTDIHAFGVTFYTMLAGLPTRDWLTPVNRHIAEEGRRLGVLQPLLELILRCVAFDPGQRPQDFVQLRYELDDAARKMNRTVPPAAAALRMTAFDYENKAVAFMLLRRYKDAETLLDQSLKAFPNHPSFWNNKGSALYWQGKYQQAIACYDRALALRPNGPDILNNKGLALRALGNLEDAIQCYAIAVQQRPDNPVLWRNLGETLQISGRLTGALNCYEQGLKAFPRDVDLLEKKTLVLLELKRGVEALACIESALAVAPRQWNLWLIKGIILHNLEQFDSAVKSYDTALSLSAEKVELYKNRAKALLHLKRYQDALASYESAIAVAPDAELWKGKGAALYLLERPDEALPSLLKAVEADDQDYGTYENLGAVLLALNRSAEALRWLEQGVKLNAMDPHLWGNLGLAQSALSDHHRALEAYEQGLRIDPNDIVLLRGKERSLKELGRLDEALQCGREATRLEKIQTLGYSRRAGSPGS